MKVKDIPKFERLNGLNTGGQQCGINVFELTGTLLSPLHINTNYDQPQIDLMVYENQYCLITNINCLINKDSHMKHVCRRCLTALSSQPVLIDHIHRCRKQQPTNVTFSWKDQLKFEDYHMKVPVPIRVYADFECINQPENNPNSEMCNPNVLFKQIPIARVFYVITPSGNKYYSYFDEGCTGGQQSCVEWFVDEMLTLQREANKYFETNKPLEMSPEEQEQFEQSTICWICENPFGDAQSASSEKVRDHDHLTGKY